jgi:hypothetical protein
MIESAGMIESDGRLDRVEARHPGKRTLLT